MGRAVIEIQCIYKIIQYMLLVQYPAEDDVLEFRASKEAVKQVGDVVIYHRLCFAIHNERMHIPAPIAIEEYVSREYFLQFAAGRGFTDTHRAAYDYKIFHKVDYLRYAGAMTGGGAMPASEAGPAVAGNERSRTRDTAGRPLPSRLPPHSPRPPRQHEPCCRPLRSRTSARAYAGARPTWA